jgi:hydroxyacid-oxoacid transhydrogenase
MVINIQNKLNQSNTETAFSIDTSSIKYGPGVTLEVGYEIARLGCKKILIVTDPNLADMPVIKRAYESLESEGLEVTVFDKVKIEPTDASFKDAILFATEGNFDGYVAIGGGSTIDTAKAANLYATYPADFLDYVNAPIGKGRAVPGQLKPLVAIPTTGGTGSETTGVAIFDLLEMKAKTGIAHRYLRPLVGLVDPDNVCSMPKMVQACSGLDLLCHGLEAYTALPFDHRNAPVHPGERPSYQGSNPISDIWATKAVEICSQNIVSAVHNADDYQSRSQMILAATFAGVGFGNAGCHLPHGMSYPVAGMVKDNIVEGYPEDHPIVPHGMSVILNAPAVFRYTAPYNPERHLQAAKLMGANIDGASLEDAGDILSEAIISLIKKIDIPNGLSGVGYSEADAAALARGAMPQHRVIKLSPRPVEESDLKQLFKDSMNLW